MENYTFNQFFDDLGYKDQEEFTSIKNLLEMSPIDKESYNNACKCLQEIIHSDKYTDTQTKIITNEFNPYIYNARDKLALQNIPFHNFWIAEIIALILNIYYLPNMMSKLYSEIYGEIFCTFIIIFEITLISLTIFGISFLNNEIKHKKFHGVITISWICMTYLVFVSANLNYLMK